MVAAVAKRLICYAILLFVGAAIVVERTMPPPVPPAPAVAGPEADSGRDKPIASR